MEAWRAERRVIDLHMHIECTPERLSRALKVMDAAGIGLGVNLSGGMVTHKPGEISEFERNRNTAESACPGRFVHYMNLDFAGWDQPDFPIRAVAQVEEGHRLGAAGLKEFKRLGLYLRDGAGRLIAVDDSRLDPVWNRCGELGMPVSIHVADPKAFWLPYEASNERWKELKDHPGWWFGDSNKFPAWKELLEALSRVIARHPRTTFVCVHFGNNAEEIDWVDQQLNRYPNMMVDLAARIPELGRHNPDQVRRLFIKHQDRILFGSDFQVYDRVVLGSSGNEPPPSDADAEVFFAKEWRWLETRDREWEHMTPIQGDWKISSIGLPAPVLRKVLFDNARKLLARSLPVPRMVARRISQDFPLSGDLGQPLWRAAPVALLDRASLTGAARPEMTTEVRALWSERFLYLAFRCPFTKLTVFDSPGNAAKRFDLTREGVSLWDRDVVEAFICPNPAKPRRYAEFEVAPTNEKLDVMVTNLPEKDFQWASGFESAVAIDQRRKVWTCEMRIPLRALSASNPVAGKQWQINLFRCDRANRAFLAFNPPLSGSFHVPERFGMLAFTE